MNTTLNLQDALRILKEDGEQYLTDSQILAITLEVSEDTAQRILESIGSFEKLNTTNWFTSIAELKLTDAQSRRLSAALAFSRRINENRDLDKVNSPGDAYEILKPLIAHKEQEHLAVLLMDTKNFVRKTEIVYIGTTNQATARIAEIFRTAVRANAMSIIISHNHPSGDPTPSPEDVEVTKAIVAAGKLLQIDVLDHVIVSPHTYLSMKERRLGF